MLYCCVGAYAAAPYYLPQLGQQIHSLEELCYILKENVIGLDSQIMQPQLCYFIEKELKLPELARSLLAVIKSGGSLGSFVSLILNEASFGTRDEIKKIEGILRDNDLKNPGVRRKDRGDLYMNSNSGKFIPAIREYRRAIEILDDEKDFETIADCYHNMGTAYARLFFYGKAAECFKTAYDMTRNKDSYMAYLASMRLGNSREKYVEKVLLMGLNQEEAMMLEKKLGELAGLSLEDEDARLLDCVLSKWKSKDRSGYMEAVKALLSKWKNELRLNMETE